MSSSGDGPARPQTVGGVGGVVLAAGGGSRFGGDVHKLVTAFLGRPLLRWAVEAALGAGLDGVVVVAGAVELGPHVPEEVALVVNERWSEGQAGSLRRGLAWCAERGLRSAVVGLGDQPLVPASAWRAVALAEGGPVVAASYGGRRRNPVRLDRAVWDLLPSSGDQGARVLMAQRPELVVEVACDGDPADVDTLEDLERWS